MADPATDTPYPASLDLLPHVPPNAHENDPGLEHDVMHARANAVLNALMALVGTVEDTDALSVLGRLADLEEGGGAGVVGPAGAGPDRIAVFDGESGGVIKDGGYTIDELRAYALLAPQNVQTATSYTLALSDAFKLVAMDSASANALTVPPNTSVAFPVGTRVDLSQDGAGQTTIVAGAGVTIRSRHTLKLAGQVAKATLINRGTDLWDLVGELEPAP